MLYVKFEFHALINGRGAHKCSD